MKPLQAIAALIAGCIAIVAFMAFAHRTPVEGDDEPHGFV